MSERWKPRCTERYYYIRSRGDVDSVLWNNDAFDREYYEFGNCFRTKKEATKAAKKVKKLLLSLQDNDGNLQDNIQDMVTDTCQAMDRGKENVEKAICTFGNLPKLPEWCKVGEWVWSIAFNTYFKVDKVDGLFIYGTDFSGSEYSVAIENVRQACPRPYNEEEMQGLIGKVVSNEHGNMFLVTAFVAVDGGEVYVDGVVYNADDLFECYTINGKPCGVLEHLDDKGEWVK